MRRFSTPLLLLLLSAAVVAGWWWPNRPVDVPGAAGTEKFNSLSYEGYRTGQSPLNDRFPSEAEADQDLALLAPRTRAIRTYAAIEGRYDIAALAQKHGLRLWQGIWLGGNRAKNTIEMDRAIALAHRFPDVIERVVVGNEVLLRRDLPPAELIADIDHVRAAVHQPVAYADVSEFWEQFPEVAPHVDYVMIHLLPYWEDTPTDIDHAVAYVGQVFRHFQALFPGKRITIGESGWPARGRQRQDAVPGLVEQARFLRGFMALSQAEHFDYNFFEAFDEDWKYESEGVVGANWGLFSTGRIEKTFASGKVSPDPAWPRSAVLSVLYGLVLSLTGLWASQEEKVFRFLFPKKHRLPLCLSAMALGCALGLAQSQSIPVLYDNHARLAAVVNLLGQAALAVLLILRVAGAVAPCKDRTGADATARVLALARLQGFQVEGALEDLAFVFVWTAMVVQALLLFDPRYRDFPLGSFAVPLVATATRAALGDLNRSGGTREDLAAGGLLAVFAVGSLVQEGWLNGQSLMWNAAALLLAAPCLLRFAKRDANALKGSSPFARKRAASCQGAGQSCRLSHAQPPKAAPTAPQVAL